MPKVSLEEAFGQLAILFRNIQARLNILESIEPTALYTAVVTGDPTATLTTSMQVLGPTLTLPAGTYLVTAHLTFLPSNNAGNTGQFDATLDVGGTEQAVRIHSYAWINQSLNTVSGTWRLVLTSSTDIRARAQKAGTVADPSYLWKVILVAVGAES